MKRCFPANAIILPISRWFFRSGVHGSAHCHGSAIGDYLLFLIRSPAGILLSYSSFLFLILISYSITCRDSSQREWHVSSWFWFAALPFLLSPLESSALRRGTGTSAERNSKLLCVFPALTRQHCRLSICENWLSWTNTQYQNKRSQ